MFKLLKRKGALFIEYALILAFVVVIGSFFIADNGIKNSIVSVFDKVNAVFDNTKSFKEKYPKNTAESFVGIAQKLAQVDSKKIPGKDLLNKIFNSLGQEQEVKFSELDPDLKKQIKEVIGINVDDYPNACFYTDNPHKATEPGAARWYVSWTGEDVSGKDGQNVAIITYSFSTRARNPSYGDSKSLDHFYVGEHIYTGGSFTNNYISYSYDDRNNYTGMEKTVVRSFENYATGSYFNTNVAEDAKNAYEAIVAKAK